MNIQIDPRNATPIYSQIVAEVEGLIGRGALRPGDRVLSVRDLAVSLRVNRNTVARAYRTLEEAGLLETRTGQGSFVGNQAGRWSAAEACELLDDSIDRLLAEADRIGVSRQAVLDRIAKRTEGTPAGPADSTTRRSRR